MPTSEEMLGFSNPWYDFAIETAVERGFTSGARIRAVAPPVVIATKLARPSSSTAGPSWSIGGGPERAEIDFGASGLAATADDSASHRDASADRDRGRVCGEGNDVDRRVDVDADEGERAGVAGLDEAAEAVADDRVDVGSALVEPGPRDCDGEIRVVLGDVVLGGWRRCAGALGDEPPHVLVWVAGPLGEVTERDLRVGVNERSNGELRRPAWRQTAEQRQAALGLVEGERGDGVEERPHHPARELW